MRNTEESSTHTLAPLPAVMCQIGELVGGSQREERLDVLKERLAGAGLAEEDYEWYLDLRRFGTVPHAGFGLGFERLVRARPRECRGGT